jgi:hypothetical protein
MLFNLLFVKRNVFFLSNLSLSVILLDVIGLNSYLRRAVNYQYKIHTSFKIILNMMKKSRGPNFTTTEIFHLLTLVEQYPIIENKKTDGATSKEKENAWQKITAEYNSQTSFAPRATEKLVSCYKNQKSKVKKIHSNDKMAIKGKVKFISCLLLLINSAIHFKNKRYGQFNLCFSSFTA